MRGAGQASVSDPTDTVRAVWIHSSPNWIEPGTFVSSAAERGVTPRTFPAGDMDDAVAKGWYDPTRVSILHSDVDPTNHLDRFAFTTRDKYMYEVEPEDVGSDLDPLARPGWHSCARAKVLRCIHLPQRPAVMDA
jgi:hypothetical protein